MDSLSPGANWDSSWRCGHGTGVRPAQLGGALRDRPTPWRRLLGAAGRSGSGSPSTIAAELKRDAGADGGYDPDAAQAQTRARRKRGLKLERDDALRERVLELLDQELSPEQGASQLRRESGPHGDPPRSDL